MNQLVVDWLTSRLDQARLVELWFFSHKDSYIKKEGEMAIFFIAQCGAYKFIMVQNGNSNVATVVQENQEKSAICGEFRAKINGIFSERAFRE